MSCDRYAGVQEESVSDGQNQLLQKLQSMMDAPPKPSPTRRNSCTASPGGKFKGFSKSATKTQAKFMQYAEKFKESSPVTEKGKRQGGFMHYAMKMAANRR